MPKVGDKLIYFAEFAQKKLDSSKFATIICETTALPLRDNLADVVFAGWSISEDNSRSFALPEQDKLLRVERAIGEMQRVTKKPNGLLVVLETLGFGHEEPTRTGSHYYRWLSEKFGFSFSWARSDYKWTGQTREQAWETVRFFYGKRVADFIKADYETKSWILLECTGIWWKIL